MAARAQMVGSLVANSLDAAAEYTNMYLDAAERILQSEETSSLTIQLPSAGPDHSDWRRSLARDLARKYAPKRVNVVSGDAPDEIDKVLTYLRNAPGVTGQYFACHEGIRITQAGFDRG